MLRVEDLCLVKGKKPILNQFSAVFLSQNITTIIGKSGSGKSSLLRCLAQLESLQSGRIIYNDLRLDLLDAKARSQILGFVPQSYSLFPHLTVQKNCSIARIDLFQEPKQVAYVRAKAVLASLGMDQFLESFPNELSGGQQQRVAIARALVMEPRFLLLDEPTSALDPENIERLIQILLKLKAQGKGIIIASHDLNFVEKISDKTIVIQ